MGGEGEMEEYATDPMADALITYKHPQLAGDAYPKNKRLPPGVADLPTPIQARGGPHSSQSGPPRRNRCRPRHVRSWGQFTRAEACPDRPDEVRRNRTPYCQSDMRSASTSSSSDGCGSK